MEILVFAFLALLIFVLHIQMILTKEKIELSAALLADAIMLTYISVFLLFYFIYLRIHDELPSPVWYLFLSIDSVFSSLQTTGRILWVQYNEPSNYYKQVSNLFLQFVLLVSFISTLVWGFDVDKNDYFESYTVLNIGLFSARLFYLIISPLNNTR